MTTLNGNSAASLPEIGLVEIDPTGAVPGSHPLDDATRAECERTARLYQNVGFVPPWVGYLAEHEGEIVGSCAFKSPPHDGRVEIAYFTYHAHEGKGIGTAMARGLVRLAQTADPQITVVAQTLPAESASTSILKKLGFHNTGIIGHPEDGPVWQWELAPSSS